MAESWLRIPINDAVLEALISVGNQIDPKKLSRNEVAGDILLWWYEQTAPILRRKGVIHKQETFFRNRIDWDKLLSEEPEPQ